MSGMPEESPGPDCASDLATAVPFAQHTNGHKPAPLRRLSALDKVFTATGEVTVRCGTRDVVLEIQSVDLEHVEALCRSYRPEVPATRELQNGKPVRVPDFSKQAYIDAMAQYNRLFSYVLVLSALRADVYDKHDRLVWSVDNSTHDIEGGKQALQDAGIVDAQLAVILDAVRALTRDVEEQQVGE